MPEALFEQIKKSQQENRKDPSRNCRTEKYDNSKFKKFLMYLTAKKRKESVNLKTDGVEYPI